MTMAQAEKLRIKRKQFGETLPCTHSSRELGQTEDGYLVGILHCVDCGEAFPILRAVV